MLSRDGRPHPLVDALAAPGARVQFAAAKALVNMAPAQPFPGSSRVVPALARFVTAQSPPRAVVIDSNPARGSQLVGSLRALGYETVMEPTGDLGFRAAAETADVELVLVSYALDRGASWGLTDTLTNLKSDARTADLPVYVYGPLNLEVNRPNLPLDFPGVKFLVQPMSPEILEKLLGGRPSKFTGSERTAYAQEATALLARIAQQPRSPFAPDLNAAEPALIIALNQPGTSLAASTALGDVPDPSAQRSLADAVLDPSRPADLRRTSATPACAEHQAVRAPGLGRPGSPACHGVQFGSRPAAPLRAGDGSHGSAKFPKVTDRLTPRGAQPTRIGSRRNR